MGFVAKTLSARIKSLLTLWLPSRIRSNREFT